MYQLNNFTFPKSFIFGVADADLQVIGEHHTLEKEKSLPTAWTYFAKEKNHVYHQHTPLDGIDRYHRWEEDANLIVGLKTKAYRTSISMARTLTKDKKPNEKALLWYRNYFKYLRKNDIKIYATLYHWEIPQYLVEQGGWKNRNILDYLVEHAKTVYHYLGEYIEEYFLLNEPFQATFESYHTGIHAPGEKNLTSGLAALHHILLAQGMMLQTLKSIDKTVKLSTVYNPSVTYAASSDPKDIKASEYAFGYHTSMFTDPLYKGEYPSYMLSLLGEKMPKIEPNDMKIIKVGDKLHSFGINYYRGKIISFDPHAELQFREIKYPQGIVNGLGWPVSIPPTYPEAFYDLVCTLYNRYGKDGMKKLYITENGTCWPDTVDEKKQVNDEFRIFYLREHLMQIQKAILAGVPIHAYFLWTLMDNYEWELGYKEESRFGLVHIDRTTMKRIPKQSYYWYKNVIRSHRLDS